MTWLIVGGLLLLAVGLVSSQLFRLKDWLNRQPPVVVDPDAPVAVDPAAPDVQPYPVDPGSHPQLDPHPDGPEPAPGSTEPR